MKLTVDVLCNWYIFLRMTVIGHSDVVGWISFASGLKAALYQVAWGSHAAVVLAGINLLSTVISLGMSCPAIFDGTALIGITFFLMAIIVLASLISKFGPMGVIVSIAMAIMMQGASLVIAGAVADGC